jgi:DNA polymerase-1
VKEDSASRAQAEQSLTSALIDFGWVGSVKPLLTVCDAPTIKLVHEIVTGEPLVSAIRTPSKLAKIITEPVLASAVASGSVEALQRLVDMHWKAAPVFNVGSPKQLQTLFYDVLELPIVVRNRPTDAARKLDKYAVGSPKTDNLAIEYALRDPSVSESTKEVLRALRVVKLTNTRFGLYYDTYPNFVHWKTGRIHSQHNQSSTNTRRASSSKPNLQQLSKGEKVEGFSPKIREMLIPHKRNAVIASFDFASQEVLLMAEWTHDPALESIFVGDNKKDFHSMTGLKIYNAQHKPEISYEQFVKANGDEDSPIYDKVSKSRKLAKAVNFGSQYRMAAPKLGTVLFVSKEEAQDFLDAKAEAFPVAEQWSQNEMELVRSTGTVKTLMGAVRHLGDVLRSDDKREVVKAERQAISFRIQGSAAEMTKLAEGRMWLSDLLDKHDCEYIASIHDEVLWSVAVDDLVEFLPKAHALMVENYAGMRLPIGSSCSIGWNFGEQVELKGDYSERNIKKALKL